MTGFFEQRLLPITSSALEQEAPAPTTTIIERLCEYQRDIQDLERKVNRCNQILRRPQIAVRDRKPWIDRALSSGNTLLGNKSRQSVGKEAKRSSLGGVARRSSRKSRASAARGSKRKSSAVRFSAGDVPEVPDVPPLGFASGRISVRVFRLKKMKYSDVGKCDYLIRVGYQGHEETFVETTAKPSEDGVSCIIQQQLFLDQYPGRELIAEVYTMPHDTGGVARASVGSFGAPASSTEVERSLIGRTAGTDCTEADFKEYAVMEASSSSGDGMGSAASRSSTVSTSIGSIVFAVKVADTKRSSTLDAGGRGSMRLSSMGGPVLRVEKVTDVPKSYIVKDRPMCVKVGYQDQDFADFKLQTLEKPPKMGKTARDPVSAGFQQSIQLDPVGIMAGDALKVALCQGPKVISAAKIAKPRTDLKALAHSKKGTGDHHSVQLWKTDGSGDSTNTRCGSVLLRLDLVPPKQEIRVLIVVWNQQQQG
ncbi:unnamed protein product [Amoebophrya sp. A25]|nr:unnamed protein product [Amoebophrya sp. A25]|eukprot:GSA25T00019321001.1